MRCTLGFRTPRGRRLACALATGGASKGSGTPHHTLSPEVLLGNPPSPQRSPQPHTHLFVQELPSVLLDVAFIQVGGEAHEPHFGEAKIRELDVAHGGDEEAANKAGVSEVRFGLPTSLPALPCERLQGGKEGVMAKVRLTCQA